MVLRILNGVENFSNGVEILNGVENFSNGVENF